MNRLLHYLRFLLRGGTTGQPPLGLFSFQTAAFERAQLLVRAFYAANLFWAGLRLEERERWSTYDALYPLWPLSWVDNNDVSAVATNIYIINAVVAVIAVIFSRSSSARWLAFGGALLAGAFENSFGRICHYGHTWVWVTFIFAFLPSGPLSRFSSSRVLRQRFLHVFWAAPFALLFFYSMAGWLKLVTVPVQLYRGEVSAVAPEALARHIANCIMQEGPQPHLANWLINHVMLGWLMYLGALYLEAVAVLIAFRPALHRLWGIGLILLHLGIGLGMEIWFVPSMFLLALLLVYSPFYRENTSWRQIALELPGMDLLVFVTRWLRPFRGVELVNPARSLLR